MHALALAGLECTDLTLRDRQILPNMWQKSIASYPVPHEALALQRNCASFDKVKRFTDHLSGPSSNLCFCRQEKD